MPISKPSLPTDLKTQVAAKAEARRIALHARPRDRLLKLNERAATFPR
jgi:hypothetical protein